MKNIRIYLATVFWIMGALLILSSLQAHAEDCDSEPTKKEQDMCHYRHYMKAHPEVAAEDNRRLWSAYQHDAQVDAALYNAEVQNQNANALDQDLIMLNQSLRINGR